MCYDDEDDIHSIKVSHFDKLGVYQTDIICICLHIYSSLLASKDADKIIFFVPVKKGKISHSIHS